MTTAAKPAITYFPIAGGRGFPVRAALRYAKVDFDDVRIPFKVFATEFKPDPIKAPLGSLPVLDLPQGHFVQSTALARWAARKSDLYPTDDVQQLIVDETMETLNEVTDKGGQDKDPVVKKALRENFVLNILPKYMALLQTRVEQSGGPFVLGKKISIADLFVFSQLSIIYSGNFDYVPADLIVTKYPVINQLFEEVKKSPIVQAELNAQPKI